jgi:transposase
MSTATEKSPFMANEFSPTRFRRWEQAWIFDRMLKVLTADLDDESVMLDASIVRVHQHGAGAKGGSNSRRSGGHEEA